MKPLFLLYIFNMLVVIPVALTTMLGESASALSHLNFWVKAFELHAGVLDAKLPVDGPLFRIGSVGPS